METDVNNKITLRALLIGLLFAAVFAGITVYASDRLQILPTATQMPVLPYVLLCLTVVLLNPICRSLRFIRPFAPAEILTVFMMGVVSAGISTYGMVAQLIPMTGSLNNRAWNSAQSQWNRYVVPFVDESFFLSAPGLKDAARRLADAEDQYANILQQLEAIRVDAAQNQDSLIACEQQLIATETAVNAARNEMQKLEEEAFAKVEVFRRGLPRGLRSYPGIIKVPEDSFSSYFARLRRMTVGRQIAVDLKHIEHALQNSGNDRGNIASGKLIKIADRFDAMGNTAELEEQVIALSAKEGNINHEIAEITIEIEALYHQRRNAMRTEGFKIDRLIHTKRLDLLKIKKRLAVETRQRESLQQQMLIIGEAKVQAEQAATLAAQISAEAITDAEALKQVRDLREGLGRLDGTLRRFLVGDVPWHAWVRPLSRWALLIGCTYLVLMALNVLMFRQWAHNEKLVYPLAELPLSFAGLDADGRQNESIYRKGLFWLGVSISGLALGYNILVASQKLPGLRPLNFENLWQSYIVNTKFEGLIGSKYARSHVFFTMIGLSFLIPRKISFSFWFFSVFSMLQVLVMVWLGYAQNEASFPMDWFYTLNFRSAQGLGALLVFALLMLYKCRAYLGCIVRPQVLSDLAADERCELKIASLTFWLGSMVIVCVLWLGMGANPFYAVAAWLILLLISLGLVRAVAEGGILGFQAWVSPFHLFRTFFGMQRGWTSPGLFMPIMFFYSVLFMDIKTFIAPAMANCLKIRDALRLQRGRFHMAMLLAIVVAATVAVIMTLLMCYANGADLMNNWFFTGFPTRFINNMATMARTPPEADPSAAVWLLVGGVMMALLLLLRQSFFWMPHPIGLVMLVNPIMGAYWFSIMLGWLCKMMVTRYGNKDAYLRVRPIFIGLIAGELLMIVIGMLVAYWLEVPMPISLDRN